MTNKKTESFKGENFAFDPQAGTTEQSTNGPRTSPTKSTNPVNKDTISADDLQQPSAHSAQELTTTDG